MIDPNEAIPIEINGHTYQVRVLRRSEKRKVLSLIEELASVESTAESVSAVLDAADKLAEMLIVGLSPESIDAIDEGTIFDIAGEAIRQQMLSDNCKKKSESVHSSSAENLHETAPQDVFVTSDPSISSAQPATV